MGKQVEELVTQGWGWPANSSKAHYFLGGPSLCMKWAFFGTLENSNHESRDNCKECQRRREKIEKRLGEKPQ